MVAHRPLIEAVKEHGLARYDDPRYEGIDMFPLTLENENNERENVMLVRGAVLKDDLVVHKVPAAIVGVILDDSTVAEILASLATTLGWEQLTSRVVTGYLRHKGEGLFNDDSE